MLGAHPTVTVIWATAEPLPGVLSVWDHSIREGQKFEVGHHNREFSPRHSERNGKKVPLRSITLPLTNWAVWARPYPIYIYKLPLNPYQTQ